MTFISNSGRNQIASKAFTTYLANFFISRMVVMWCMRWRRSRSMRTSSSIGSIERNQWRIKMWHSKDQMSANTHKPKRNEGTVKRINFIQQTERSNRICKESHHQQQKEQTRTHKLWCNEIIAEIFNIQYILLLRWIFIINWKLYLLLLPRHPLLQQIIMLRRALRAATHEEGKEGEERKRSRFNEQSDFNDALKMSVDGKRLHWISFPTGFGALTRLLPFLHDWMGGWMTFEIGL